MIELDFVVFVLLGAEFLAAGAAGRLLVIVLIVAALKLVPKPNPQQDLSVDFDK